MALAKGYRNVTISSMTGFARIDRALEDFLWTWELKGVNGRNLDLRCRLPVGYESLDSFVRAAAAGRLKRGNLTVTLSVSERQTRQVFRINEGALAQIAGLVGALRARIEAAPPRVDGLLALRGVLEVVESPPDEELTQARLSAIRDSFSAALDALAGMRLDEGAALASIVHRQLDAVEGMRMSALGLAETQPGALRDRLLRKMAELLPPAQALSEERLAQEVALLAQRADVREELDRLAAHVTAARRLLEGGGAIGRKFDFLCQEFNREANTLCSKADDLALTNLGIELKAAIEQLREQVQNIE